MSKGKEKVVEIDDDELDFLPSLLADPAFDLGIPLEPIRYSVGTSARRMIPGKKDTPIRPPRGYVTLFLESFKLGLRCYQSEPTVDEVKYLYQLKSRPKDAGWYYFQSSTKTRKPITDLPTGGGGGNWKKKFFFAEGPWGQVAQIDGKDYRVPPCFVVLGVCTISLNLSRSSGSRLCWPIHVPPLRTLPPPPTKAGETSGAATDPASSFPPVGSKPRVPDTRPKHLVPYINEFSKLVSKKDFEDFDGSTLGELVGAMQYNAFHLGWMAIYYKAKVGRYDRKMKEDIQSGKTKADAAEKRAGDLNLENLKLIERESLAQAKAITLEEELTKVKKDLQRQKAMYKAQLESLWDSHQVQVENLEKETDNQYDQGLRYSYRCIMAVLGKQHPDLKMDELAASVAQYMDEEVAKEDIEEVEPNATEEGASPPHPFPADVAEASTPPGATGEPPLLLRWSSQ
ncbi:uncharacterized protein LOC107176391 [Citrus sinensis]|uniref:uncharacterized protein LOC107176391 n=1 Tax=Citrus sinensis TaxID=2711 RepID=UPI0007636B91|nr:uncharacterized protein LOC107176391 [Citrus sinensis]XP_024039355.1 uncharacterized protein LOC112097988 [Citrus x clementina]